MRNACFAKRLYHRWCKGKVNFDWYVRVLLLSHKMIEANENMRAEMRYFLHNRDLLMQYGKLMPTSM